MTEKTQIETVIRRIRESFDGAEEVYTNGSCIQFCLILEEIFTGKIWYNQDHAVFEYAGSYWDVTGEVELPEGSQLLSSFSAGIMADLLKLKGMQPRTDPGLEPDFLRWWFNRVVPKPENRPWDMNRIVLAQFNSEERPYWRIMGKNECTAIGQPTLTLNIEINE